MTTPTLLDHFKAQCQLHPAAISIDDGTKYCAEDTRPKLTYSELDVLSEQWSKQLHSAGVRAGAIVPLLSRRCISMVAAVLAILKLRATYVPVDLDSWGEERIKGVLDRINPSLVVATSCPNLPLEGRSLLVLEHGRDDDGVPDAEQYPSYKDKNHSGSIDDIAYIIFTSGTTGRPKGVMISQRSISSYVKQGGELPFNLNATVGTRVLLICSVAFDACAGILFTALCNGGTLVLADPSTLEPMAKKCTSLPVTPSILASLDPTAGFDAVEQIFLGGEVPSPSLVEAWTSPNRRLYNAYGPTETTCSAFIGELKTGSPATIGYPISYSKAFLVDENGQESSEGEVWISGLGLAIGYYQDPNLTDESFVMRGGTRFYRTGDYGKHTPDGLQFCGRRDNLVKHRGFLVNLETDVEPALLACANVDRAASLIAGDKLVAFVTPNQASVGLQAYLSARYSSFQVPDVIYGLDDFPITGNGKIDRRALLAIHQTEDTAGNTALLSQGLDPLEAVQRAVSHVLEVPLPRVLESSSLRGLGGHSLAAVRLVSVLRKMGYSTDASQVLLLDTVEELATSIHLESPAEVKPPDEPELQLLPPDVTTTDDLHASAIVPMTDMQTRLVRSSIVNPGLAYIRVSFTFDHSGDAAFLPKLRSAWTRVHERHAILRTSFSLSSSHGAQLVSPDVDIAWEEKLVTQSEWESAYLENGNLQPGQFKDFSEENRQHLSSAVTFTVRAKCTRFIWTIHHSLVDGWSMGILMADLAASFDGKPLPQPAQFSDAAITLKCLESERKNTATSFWSKNLEHYIPVSRLRLPQPSGLGNFTQSEQHAKLTPRISDLDRAASVFNVTPACLLYATWALLLSRYCGSDRVIVGTVLSGRNLPIPGIDGIVGPLINTLPLAIEAQDTKSTADFVRSVFRTMCGILEFQWSSNSLIQDACGVKATDLFETLFVLQYDFPSAPWQSTKTSPPRDIRYNETTEMPLTVLVDRVDGEFGLRFIYLRSHFFDSTIQNMIRHFDNLLSAILRSDPGHRLESVSEQMIDQSEIESLAPPPKEPSNPPGAPKTLGEAINRSLREYRNATAVECPAKSITYSELGEMTSRIASQLISKGAGGKVVCVISDGSLYWQLAIIGAIRVSATYCPIDYKLPMERQRYMVGNSRASLVLFPTVEARRASSTFDGVTILDIESILCSSPAVQSYEGEYGQTEDDICCFIYTSGSTGLPKAVQLHHRGVLNLLAQPQGQMYSKPGQRNAQALSVGFDCCILEIFATLCNGATLVLKDPDNPISNLSRVDTMVATPSLLSVLDPSDHANLKVIITVGEPCTQLLNDKWSVGRTFINVYAPAECTLFCMSTILEPDVKVSVGKSVDGMTAYILDAQMRPVPVGVSGEVYLSGVQVARGYLYNEEETNRRFIPDPFHPQLRMFRTGDIGRWLENGNIDLLGREDNMIKLRGFRIDLGEVQTAIARVALEAKHISVIVWNGNLYAFVTPANVDVNGLHDRLAEQLPEYAIPSRVIALEGLPVSANHKVDREALQELVVKGRTGRPLSQPLTTPTEHIIAGFWAEVLGLDTDNIPVGASDRFFALGGHSILQIKVAQAIEKHWNIPLPLKEVISYPILRDLCRAIDEKLGSQEDFAIRSPFMDFEPIDRNGELPVSYLESEMLLNHLISNGSPASNMRFVCEAMGELNTTILADAFRMVANLTEVVQSRYIVSCGSVSRCQAEVDNIPQVVEAEDAESIIQSKLNREFDLSVDSPVDVSIIVEGPAKATIVVVMSHIVGDATTLANYLNHVSSLYYSLLRQPNDSAHGVAFRESTQLSYLDWAKWIESTQLEAGLVTFWKSYLSDLPEPLSLGNPGAILTYQGSTTSSIFPSSLRSDLSQLAAVSSLTMHQLVLGAAFLCLHCVDSRDDMIFAAPFTRRTEAGTEDIPGLFLDRLILRIRRGVDSTTDSLADFLKSVQESSQQALAHTIPFHSLRKVIDLKPSLSSLLFKVMVTYHTKTESPMLQLDGATIHPLRRYNNGAKFPLAFEFTELPDGGVLLEMEHDTGVVTEDTARRLEYSLNLVLRLMVLNTPISRIIHLVTSSFRSAVEVPSTTVPDPDVTFISGSQQQEHTSHDPAIDVKRDVIQEAMAESLGLSGVSLGVDQSFWDSGAESIDGLKLQYLCEQRGVNIALHDVFVCESTADLAMKAVLVT